MTSLVVSYALHNSENILTNYLNRKGVFKVEAVTVHSGYVTETICGSHLLKGKNLCIFVSQTTQVITTIPKREQVIYLNHCILMQSSSRIHVQSEKKKFKYIFIDK